MIISQVEQIVYEGEQADEDVEPQQIKESQRNLVSTCCGICL